jgi:hypothetical protein
MNNWPVTLLSVYVIDSLRIDRDREDLSKWNFSINADQEAQYG